MISMPLAQLPCRLWVRSWLPSWSRLGSGIRAAWLAILLLWGLQTFPLHAAPPHQTTDPAIVYLLTFEGPVTPVLESYLTHAIGDAQAIGAAAVILQLDTPGGSVEVTKSIIQQMLISPVPLIVFVAPAGARAGSAGTFITLAAHIAAMAPSSSIGAASPVELGGGDVDSTLAAKITNILSADIENLASRRGEAATEWAIAAVQDAAAATAPQALELGVIDLIATDIDDLLTQVDGMSVTLPTGTQRLNVTNARIVIRELSPIQRALNLLVDPSLATVLMSLGILGLFIEIRTPGLGVPGILGVLSILLAFYGLGQLDANFTGLAFIFIALVLFVAEAFTPTFGVLAIGGVIAFLFGGALLFDTPGLVTPWTTLILLALLLGGFTLFAGHRALTSQRGPVMTGSEALIGAKGIAKSAFLSGETGNVLVHGELWNARSGSEVIADMPVRVLARDGFTLIVTPIQNDAVVMLSGEASTTPSTEVSNTTPRPSAGLHSAKQYKDDKLL